MIDHLELIDIIKTLSALVAGMTLGLERELKDKSAGLKTMSVICLGATLFSIISYKVGGPENTRIASYIVSGVGFIGAGVIFKDGLTISGLTTAGIIWLAAAIGTAIGFGEFYLAGIFLLVSLLLIYSSTYINKILKSRKQIFQLEIEIEKKDKNRREDILAVIRNQGIGAEEKGLELKNGNIKVTTEIEVKGPKIKWLQDYLLQHEYVQSFNLYG
ncbi:MAG: MgtC/SapB family protein [Chitinophagaceae bacterium]